MRERESRASTSQEPGHRLQPGGATQQAVTIATQQAEIEVLQQANEQLKRQLVRLDTANACSGVKLYAFSNSGVFAMSFVLLSSLQMLACLCFFSTYTLITVLHSF